LDKYLAVFAGAGLGGVARYALGVWVMTRYGGRFPLGTLVVNVSGAFLMGLTMTILSERMTPHPAWRMFLIVGVLGGYTTYSAFAYETLQAIKDGERLMGLLYVVSTVVAAYLAVWLGTALAARR
jgi:CrcB protein